MTPCSWFARVQRPHDDTELPSLSLDSEYAVLTSSSVDVEQESASSHGSRAGTTVGRQNIANVFRMHLM